MIKNIKSLNIIMNDQIMNDLEIGIRNLTLNDITFNEFIDYKVTRIIYETLNKVKKYPYPNSIEGWVSLLHNFIYCYIEQNDRRPNGIPDGEYFFDIQTIIARLLDTRVLVEINKTYHVGLDSVFAPSTKKRVITDYFEQQNKRVKII